MKYRSLTLVLLLLSGCVAALAGTEAKSAPTLRVGNWTDNQINVTVDGTTIARIGAMSQKCFKLRNLPPGSVVLVFRAIGNPRALNAQPVDYSLAEHWELDITGATNSGGFAPGATQQSCK